MAAKGRGLNHMTGGALKNSSPFYFARFTEKGKRRAEGCAWAAGSGSGAGGRRRGEVG